MIGTSDTWSYMSVHVYLNSLNKVGKSDRMWGFLRILSLYRNKFNKVTKTQAEC